MTCLLVLKAWWRTFFDLVTIAILFTLFVGLLIAERVGSIVRRGFYCDDSSIRFPAKPSTVPAEALVTVGILLVLFVVSRLAEYVVYIIISIVPDCYREGKRESEKLQASSTWHVE